MLSAPDLRLLPGLLGAAFIREGVSLDSVSTVAGRRGFRTSQKGRKPFLPSNRFASCRWLGMQRKKAPCLFWAL